MRKYILLLFLSCAAALQAQIILDGERLEILGGSGAGEALAANFRHTDSTTGNKLIIRAQPRGTGNGTAEIKAAGSVGPDAWWEFYVMDNNVPSLALTLGADRAVTAAGTLLSLQNSGDVELRLDKVGTRRWSFANNGNMVVVTGDGNGVYSFTNSGGVRAWSVAIENQTQAAVTTETNPVIYATGNAGGGYPFTESGHLIVSPRITGASRHVILRTAHGRDLTVRGDTGNTLLGTDTDDGVNKLQVNGGIAAASTIDAGTFVLLGTRTASSGLGGNIRHRDDTGTVRWTTGLLGTAAATSYSIYDSVNSLSRLTITSTASAAAAAALAADLAISGTSAVKGIRTAVANLDFPSISAGGSQTLTVTVTGVAVGNCTAVANTSDGVLIDAGCLLTATATAANTVSIRITNITGSPIDPAAQNFRVTVTSF